MSNKDKVLEHYTNDNLLQNIISGLEASGISLDSLTPNQLSAVDEFHIGGTEATDFVLKAFEGITKGHILDIGCGIGGPARHISSKSSLSVTGIDLTPGFIRVGESLNKLVDMDDTVNLSVANATDLTFGEQQFDGAYMIHVGMNIQDKSLLFRNINKILREKGLFVIYDVMKTSNAELDFPLPWATDERSSSVSSKIDYLDLLNENGFAVLRTESKRQFAISFFEQMTLRNSENGPPPLGLHLVIGENAPIKMKNVYNKLVSGILEPVLIVAQKK